MSASPSLKSCPESTIDEARHGKALQVASEPTRISVAVQMGNLTREMIEKTGKFNVSVLAEDVPFETIRHFGMQTGREVDKFEATSF